jgi:putative transposase
LEEKKELIEFENGKLTIKRQCELLDLSRSTAYYPVQIQQPTQEEIDIKNAIDQIHFNEPAYGCRRIQQKLNELGFTIGLKGTRFDTCRKWIS